MNSSCAILGPVSAIEPPGYLAMEYDKLDETYWRKQVERVIRVRDKINERAQSAKEGRVIPDGDDLAIGTGRQLPMAILFLDISGFSGRVGDLAHEQEMILRILNLFFTEMIRVAEDYGGTVEKNTGDGLMAYFEDGGGTPTEGGSKRAVASALTMMDASRHLINPILVASGISPIQFRISVDHGRVTVGRLGAPRRFNAAVAVGTAPNVASKMLSFAGPGEIVLGERAKTRLPPSWQWQWTELGTRESGWIYRLGGRPYPLYRYTGRWTEPR